MFSLGATLAFAALGSSPFGTGRVPDVLKRVVEDEPELSAVPDGLSDRLYAVDVTNGQEAWHSPDCRIFHAMAAAPDGATVYAAGPDYQGHERIVIRT
ncbi:hypothetical protein [Streptomyces sp. NEAU-L66]|uniref:hypothetical protein n=1 Tax=Streptomyces sp. NEAU-L66 TaxID=3390812 RepID=UPI0039C715F0